MSVASCCARSCIRNECAAIEGCGGWVLYLVLICWTEVTIGSWAWPPLICWQSIRATALGGTNGGNGFVEGREDMGGTDSGSDAVAVHVGAEIGGDTGKDDRDVVGREIGEQVADGAGSGEVEVGDGAGVDYEPMNGCWSAFDKRAHVFNEAAIVGVKEVGAEAIDDEARFGLLAWRDGNRLPEAIGAWDKHHRMRAVAVADVAEEREGDRKQDALFDADADDTGGRDGGEGELTRTFTADVAQGDEVDHADRNGENDGAEHAAREVLQRSCEEQQDQQDDGGEGKLGHLTARARAVRHGSLGWAAVDHEGPADGGGGVGCGEAEDVGVFVDGFIVTRREDARRGGALRDDHDEA